MSVLVKGIDLPKCCDDCFALDDNGDYPFCLITQEQRGYNFHTREKRMDECPFVEVETLHNKVIKDKYDCNKTLDYTHERKRMCDTVKDNDCDNCKLQGVGGSCFHAYLITQEHIDIVQKWSNEHPEKTRADVFFRMFPNAARKGTDKETPVICYQHLINIDRDFSCQEDYKCRVCWNKPYNGEFE